MSSFTSALILLCLTVSLSRACRHMCTGESCDAEPGPCLDGEVTLCGLRQCARGPGDSCGGLDERHGRCGPGMKCTARRVGVIGLCTGCSTIRYASGIKPYCRPWDPPMSL